MTSAVTDVLDLSTPAGCSADTARFIPRAKFQSTWAPTAAQPARVQGPSFHTEPISPPSSPVSPDCPSQRRYLPTPHHVSSSTPTDTADVMDSSDVTRNDVRRDLSEEAEYLALVSTGREYLLELLANCEQRGVKDENAAILKQAAFENYMEMLQKANSKCHRQVKEALAKDVLVREALAREAQVRDRRAWVKQTLDGLEKNESMKEAESKDGWDGGGWSRDKPMRDVWVKENWARNRQMAQQRAGLVHRAPDNPARAQPRENGRGGVVTQGLGSDTREAGMAYQGSRDQQGRITLQYTDGADQGHSVNSYRQPETERDRYGQHYPGAATKRPLGTVDDSPIGRQRFEALPPVSRQCLTAGEQRMDQSGSGQGTGRPISAESLLQSNMTYHSSPISHPTAPISPNHATTNNPHQGTPMNAQLGAPMNSQQGTLMNPQLGAQSQNPQLSAPMNAADLAAAAELRRALAARHWPPAAPPPPEGTNPYQGGYQERQGGYPDTDRQGALEKDETYWERRRKNNEAAKRSRDSRRAKEEQIASRAAMLAEENLQLRAQIAILKTETANLHLMLYNRM